MFFRMLKKDLTDKIGLNIVLMLFMITAAILTAASSIQLYAYCFGKESSYKRCNTSDISFIAYQDLDRYDEQISKIVKFFEESENVAAYSRSETIMFDNIRLAEADTGDYDLFDLNSGFMTTLPKEMNLVYDLNSRPFYVENGTIAISQNMMTETGISEGDNIRITTQMGYTYEFTVSHVFKDPFYTYNYRIIVSDADYSLIRKESPVLYDRFEVQYQNGYYDNQKFIDDLCESGIICITYINTKSSFSNDSIIAMVVAIFMSAISIFIIMMIFMTIRFTLLSAIKRESKEIGMMKALGVDSLSFRWLFAAKYIAFSVIGGVFGIVCGIPIAKILMSRFCINMLEPENSEIIIIALTASALVTLLIIVFTMLAMRKMKNITVMDAIHGGNKGENANLLSGFSLSGRKKMGIPFFLALTDIFGRAKRYIFLIIAYTFGIAAVMLPFHVRNTVMSEEYICRVFPMQKIDFSISFSDDFYNKYIQKYGSYAGILDRINIEFEENGIPAEIGYARSTNGSITDGDDVIRDFIGYYGELDTKDYYYSKGKAPEAADEIAISHYDAKDLGINIGDSVHLYYEGLDEKGIDWEEKEGDFTVTGFVPVAADTIVIFGNGFVNNSYGVDRQKMIINAPDPEHQAVIQQIRELYPACTVFDREETIDRYLSGYDDMFVLMRNTIAAIVLGVFLLITLLYEEIFIEDETADIALLKSLGVSQITIKAWHFLRMLILTAVSYIMALIVETFAGQPVLQFVMEALVRLSGFELKTDKIAALVIVPILSCAAIFAALIFKLGAVNKIELQNIRED